MILIIKREREWVDRGHGNRDGGGKKRGKKSKQDLSKKKTFLLGIKAYEIKGPDLPSPHKFI